MYVYWAQEALSEYRAEPTPERLDTLLQRIVEALEELGSSKANIPEDERGV